jgi:tetratricopeptide (TPR) repeat protein
VQKDIPRALAVMQLAHRKKLLDEDTNVRKLASLLQSEDIPYRSVKVLEQGLAQKVLKEDENAYELLGNSWILAREAEKAEPALKKAAELSPKGALYVRLGQVLLLKEDYDGAASALKSGLAKGGLDDPGSAEMLLGITYFNAGKLGEARNWFQKSRRSDKARPTADAWIKHIDEELAKQNGDSTGPAGSVGL